MKYNQFKTFLQEVLTPSQKEEVNTWKKGDNSFTDHIFGGEDTQRKSFELESPRKSDHEDVVKQHIEPHGFKIKDYKSGTAIDKHGRDTTIGKALNKVKAPEEVANKFQNDPHRQQKSAENLHVSLSRHAHDVAGMTSKGQSWSEESCMNFCTGSNRHYLPEDVKHGTHVAYLTDKDDHENSRPLARIALKKHTNVDDPNDHILLPEHRTYGAAPGSFEHTVHRIVEKHFPHMDNGIYKKNENVYDDTGSKYFIGKNKIGDALDHKNYNIREAAIQSPHIKEEHISKALNDKNSDIREAAIKHPKATEEQISKVLNDKNEHPTIRAAAINHKNATSEHISKALTDKDSYIRAAAISNEKATPEHISKVLNNKDEDYSVREAAIQNKNATPEHISKVLNDKDEDFSMRRAAIKNRNATKEHISKILGDIGENFYMKVAAIRHKNATKEHFKQALNDKDSNIRNIAKERLEEK